MDGASQSRDLGAQTCKRTRCDSTNRREKVRVEREPITDASIDRATDGPAISEDEHEVVLHEEEVVIEKRAVPKERVRLDKDVITEEQQVSDQVRKEQIDIDTGHGGTDDRG